MTFVDRVRALVQPHEGCKPFLYLDTAKPPRVTVGIGNAVTLRAALCLPFTIDGRPATADEITADYNRVARAAGGLRAEAYSLLSVCRLSDEAIVQLFEKRIPEFEKQLLRIFPAYATFPEPARLALLDLIFQTGAGNLTAHFPNFVACVRATPPDWEGAAHESHRRESSDERNGETFALFEEAARLARG